MEYRYAENQIDRLPALAADLVRRRVAVIVASGALAMAAAKVETTTIPIGNDRLVPGRGMSDTEHKSESDLQVSINAY
jgi:hypothetical protein